MLVEGVGAGLPIFSLGVGEGVLSLAGVGLLLLAGVGLLSLAGLGLLSLAGVGLFSLGWVASAAAVLDLVVIFDFVPCLAFFPLPVEALEVALVVAFLALAKVLGGVVLVLGLAAFFLGGASRGS